jgi:hypothetical protein
MDKSGSKKSLQAAQKLELVLERITLDRKLSFWLPLRAIMNKEMSMVNKLKMDYGNQVFNRD